MLYYRDVNGKRREGVMGRAQFKGEQYGNSYTATTAHRVEQTTTIQKNLSSGVHLTAQLTHGFTSGSNTVYTGKQHRTTRGWNRRFDLLRVIANVASAAILHTIWRLIFRLRYNFPYTIVHLPRAPSLIVFAQGQ